MSLPTTIDKILDGQHVESVRLEFKESWNPEACLHTICAFANDIDNFYGGYIILGLKDDGSPSNSIQVNQIDGIQKDIFYYCKKCLIPSYLPIIDVINYKNTLLIAIWCPVGDKRPYKCLKDVYGITNNKERLFYIRKGSVTAVGSENDELELKEYTNHEPYDDRINYKVSVDVLEKSIVDEYLKQSGASLNIGTNSTNFQSILEDLRVVGGPSENIHPKNIALLMFTSKPSNYIPFSYIDLTISKNTAGTEVEEKVFDGPVFKQYIDCMNYLKNNVISKKIYKIPGKYKSQWVYNYSYEVLEEVVANAILHKSYQQHEPVSVRVEQDHIEINNVPGFDRTIPITSINILKPKSKRYTNRRLAEFLKDLHIVEAKNTGYPTILNATIQNGSPLPIIDMNEERDYVTIIIPIHNAFKTEAMSLADKIIDALNVKSMTKTELSRYLGYKRVVNSISYQLDSLIKDNKVKVINRIYSLK